MFYIAPLSYPFIRQDSYVHVESVFGKDLRKDWGRYVNHFFLDEQDQEVASLFPPQPQPIVEFLFWIETNPDLTFHIFEFVEVCSSVH